MVNYNTKNMTHTPENPKIVITDAELEPRLHIDEHDLHLRQNIVISDGDTESSSATRTTEQRAGLEAQFADAREKALAELGQVSLQDSVQLKNKAR